MELNVIRPQSKAQGSLLLHRSMGRYVKELKSGALKINKARGTQNEKRDGKYLLSTSDLHLSAEDIALGYKQLLEFERAFRTLKGALSLRPAYHSRDDRIRSHVLICWLALLLVGVAAGWRCRSGNRTKLAEDPSTDAVDFRGHLQTVPPQGSTQIA